MKKELKQMVEKYTTQKGSGDITIPIYDLLVMYNALDEICSEYCGAEVIENIYRPIEERYRELYDSLKERG
jgi:hypothetical protein